MDRLLHDNTSSEAAGSSTRFRKWAWVGVRIVVAVATVSILLRELSRKPLPELPCSWQAWASFVGAAALLPVIVLVRVLKWQALIRIALPGAGFRDCLKSYLAAMPYGLITPGRFGELMRLAYLPPLEGGYLRGAGLVVLDRALDLASLLWPAAIGLWLLAGAPAGLAAVAAGVAGLTMGWWLKLWSTAVLRLPERWRLRGLALPAESLPLQLMLYLQALGFLAHLAVGMQYVLVMGALSVAPIPWLKVVGVMSVVTLVNTIPITIAGLGVREGLAVLFLGRWGISAGVAGVGAFAAFALDSGVLSLAGLMVSTRQGAGAGRSETILNG